MAVLLRHAERHAVTDLRTHEAVLLTPRGHQHAREAGERLGASCVSLRVLHSPVERCRETARAIVDGALRQGVRAQVEGKLDALGSPFVKDLARAADIAQQHGFPGFLRAWFDGVLPYDVFAPAEPAAHEQVDAAARAIKPGADLHVLVTHDWNIALIKEKLLGVRIDDNKAAWPNYLDGLVVAVDAHGNIHVEAHGRRASIEAQRASTPPVWQLGRR